MRNLIDLLANKCTVISIVYHQNVVRKVRGTGVDDFIVLGIIPGTSIQITFEMWLQFVTALIAAMVTIKIGVRLIQMERSRQFQQSNLQTATD